MAFPIDFVVCWVDERDPDWRAKNSKYDSAFTTSENNTNFDEAYC